MGRMVPVAALLFWGAGIASGQSLAEVAKKEKDRRSQSKSVPVIDNDELSRAQGDGVSVMGRDPSETDATADSGSTGEDSTSGPASSASLSQAEIREYRETWNRVWPQRLAAAEKELELAEEAVFQCQSAAHYVYVPLAVDCDGIYERRALAEYRLKQIRENRFNWELLLPETSRPPPQP